MNTNINLGDEIQQHRQLRAKLNKFIIREPSNSLDLFTIGRDTNCRLGEWLFRMSRTSLAETTEFKTLVLVHRSFHAVAYEVLSLVMGRHEEEAYALLNGAYQTVETQLIEAILNVGDLQTD